MLAGDAVEPATHANREVTNMRPAAATYARGGYGNRHHMDGRSGPVIHGAGDPVASMMVRGPDSLAATPQDIPSHSRVAIPADTLPTQMFDRNVHHLHNRSIHINSVITLPPVAVTERCIDTYVSPNEHAGAR
jgi:hypothetical protein